MPRTRRGKGAAATGSGGHKKPATEASSGVVHPGKGAAVTGSGGHKKPATAASSGVVHPGKGAAATGSGGHKKPATAASSGVVHPGKGAAVSIGEMLQKKAAAAASSEGVPTLDPGKMPSGSDSSEEILQILVAAAMAAAPSSGGARTMDPGKMPSGSDYSDSSDSSVGSLSAFHGNTTAQDREESDAKHRTKRARTVWSAKIPHGHWIEDEDDMGLSGGMLQKENVTSGVVHPSKGAAATGSGGHKKPATAASSGVVHPGKGAAVSIGEMLQKKAAAAASSEGVPMLDPGKMPSGSDSSEEMLQILVAAAMAAAPSSGGARTMDPGKVRSGSDYSDSSDSSVGSLSAFHGNTTAQDREESDAKHRTKRPRTVLSAKIPHEHWIEDEDDMGLSGGMLQKKSPKSEADSGSSVDMLHEHPGEEADTAKGIQESDFDEIVVHAKEEDTRLQELEDLVKEIDASCIGEQISSDEFLGYFEGLARDPPWTDLVDKLEDKDICTKEDLHAVYRLKYLHYQLKIQMSKGELLDDKLKSLLDISVDDCTPKFLEEEEFFRRFEEDWTLDWFFHPDYEYCSSLSDYQRLVLRNYGGTEYTMWSEYHEYLHSYKIEREYVKYCEELSVKLKWMEDYVGYCPSLKWNYITDRGAYQAIKIAATDYQDITPVLAYNGYNEFLDSMSYDFVWFKEYDGLYFEIWRRITQNSLSFEDALAEVCKLNMFPLRQGRLEGALECDYTMMLMETEYKTCTEAITKEDTEDKARKLIAEAVPTRVNKPKSYEQYIRKKIHIARIIGILPQED